MFPLKARKLIRGFQAHINAGLGGAGDYVADKTPLFAPFSGKLETYYGNEGGNWARLTRANGDKIEMAHLSKYLQTGGQVSQGEQIAITGNTGSITTGPHLHLQIIQKGKRLDPEKYNWELNKTFMKVTIVANKIAWNFQDDLLILADWFKRYSNNKLEVVFDVKQTSFDNVPLAPFKDGLKAVDIQWYRDHVTPLAIGEATLFLMNPNDYHSSGNPWGFMTYADNGKPVRMEVACLDEPNYPTAPRIVHDIFHETCHALYFLTGQPDISHTNPNDSRVHELLFVPEPQQTINRSILLNEIDYAKLQEALVKIKPSDKIKVRQVGWSGGDKEKGIYVPFDTPATQAEIISKINEILPKYELDVTKEYNLGKRPF